jgi:hypothetical protein
MIFFFFFFVMLYSNFVMNTLKKIPGATTDPNMYNGLCMYLSLSKTYIDIFPNHISSSILRHVLLSVLCSLVCFYY